MNCIRILSVAVLSVLLFAALASAQSTFVPNGSALVPSIFTQHVAYGHMEETEVFISNISNTDVQCRVTVYDQDGNDISTHCSVFTGGPSTLVKLSSGVNTFDLPANSTRMFQIYLANGPTSMGYSIIEWASSDAKQRKSLVAGIISYGRRHDDSDYASRVFVNGGQPF